jgi:hypothetical protein
VASDPPDHIDWLFVGRYALLAGLCALIPIPVVDVWFENALRRRMVRGVALRRGVTLPPADLATLGDAGTGGCLGLFLAVLLWPIKKVLKTIFVVFQVKAIADTVSEVVHRALLVEEALERGWLPGDAARVRAAMDLALAHVDTRPIERSLNGPLRDARRELDRVIWESVRIARRRRDRPAQAVADAAEAQGLGDPADTLAMTTALRVRGLVPELVGWFRAEMGAPPTLEQGLAGPIVPELLPADGPGEPERALPAPVEDAEEVPK